MIFSKTRRKSEQKNMYRFGHTKYREEKSKCMGITYKTRDGGTDTPKMNIPKIDRTKKRKNKKERNGKQEKDKEKKKTRLEEMPSILMGQPASPYLSEGGKKL